MTLLTPIFMQAAVGDAAISYSALAVRALVDAFVPDEGVLSGLRVSQRSAGPNMSVDVAVGTCVVLGDDVAGQGKYLCPSNAVNNVTVPAAPGSGSRVHRVVARVRDKLHNGTWTTYEWVQEVLADTGSGTPALPASAITLATVTVSAGQVSVLNTHISNLAVPARVAGVPRAQATKMVSTPSFSVAGAWTDFTSGQMPPITLTTPASGTILVQCGGGDMHNNNSSTATLRLGFRVSGTDTVAADTATDHQASVTGADNYSLSRRVPVTGLTPGGTITVTPQWRISSGTAGNIGLNACEMIVEPVA